MNRATPFTRVFRLTPGRQALPLGLNALPCGINAMAIGLAPLPDNDPRPALPVPPEAASVPVDRVAAPDETAPAV